MQLFAGLNPERILGAAMAIGMGRWALEAGVKFAKERTVWKTPIGAHQGLAHPLAQCKIELELAKLMMQKAPRRSTTAATTRGRRGREHGQVRGRRGRHQDARPGHQTHGGGGLTRSTASRRCSAPRASGGFAPVSREMILNFVAQHPGPTQVRTEKLQMTNRQVRYEVADGVATLTLDSPHNRNAISSTLVGQLRQGLTDAQVDDGVRTVVLAHTGGTFCAGADLSKAVRPAPTRGPDELAAERTRQMTELLRAILELR